MYQQVLKELRARRRQEFMVRYCVSLVTTLSIVYMYCHVVTHIH